jgi:serine/threonine protein kinase
MEPKRTIVPVDPVFDADPGSRTTDADLQDVLPVPMGPLPSFPGYEVLGELGRGGMGIVYKARHCKRGQLVALKTLQGMTPQGLYRFKQEFRTLAGVLHQNLIALYDLVSDGQQWFFTMELVEGVDFLAYVQGELQPIDMGTTVTAFPAPPVSEALFTPARRQRAVSSRVQVNRLREALRQLAQGVVALHDAGKLHCDIKPRNVLVTAQGRVVLLDFGLAAELGPAGVHEITEPQVIGTVTYMSPEQAASQPLSPASDWYSVGVILYMALTGRPPHHGTALQVLLDKQHCDPPAPRNLVPEVPADLETLCLELLNRAPDARPTGRDVLNRLAAPAAEIARSTAVRPARAQHSPLIGRQFHLSALNDAFLAVTRGQPVSVYIRGHSGMGKSALIQNFLEGVLERHDAVVLFGRCYERESVPYKALDSFVDALTRHLRRLPASEVEALLPRDVFALARVFPVLSQLKGAAKAPRHGVGAPDAQELRRRAFAALRELLARLGDRKPLILCIDDLQWGDVDSAALLTDLQRSLDPPVLLLLGCYRSEEAALSPCLRVLLQEPEKGQAAVDRRELVVDALNEADARNLAEALLGRCDPVAKDQAAVIARESGGNPFFVYELVQYVLAADGPAGTSLPAGELVLEKVLWERVSHLPADARRMLEVLAVAGQPLRPEEASQAAELGAADRPALALLHSGRLIRSIGTAHNERLETYHDQVRECVVAHLPPSALTKHHERLAVVLESTGTADPEVLAVHYLGAGMPEKASTHYTQAAAQAAEALAFDRAAKLYRTALELRPREDAEGRLLRAQMGDALANAGRGAEAAAVYLAAARDAPSAEVLDLERRATHQYLTSGHTDEGLTVFRTVLGRLGMSLPGTPRRALWSLLLRRLQLRLRGLAFHTRAPDSCPIEDLTRIDVCWAAFTGLSMVDTIRGAYFQTRGLLMALNLGEPFRIARSLAMEAAHVSVAGGPSRRRVAQLLQVAESLTEKVDHPYLRALMLFAKGVEGYLVGEWQNSLDFCDQSEALLRANCTGVTWELDSTRTFALWDLIRLGEFAELTRRWPTLLAEAKERGDRYAVTNLSTHIMSIVRLAADDPATAHDQVEAAMGQWSQQGFHIQHHNALRARTDILLYKGAGEAAWNLMSAQRPKYAHSMLKRIQQTRIDVENWHARSALAAAATTSNPAPLLSAALASARRLEQERMAWSDAQACLIRAGIAAGSGQTTSAVAILREASSRLDAVGLNAYAAAARARLGGLLGGNEGSSLLAQAHAWMAAKRVRHPARMTALLAPGYPSLGAP